MTVHSFRPRHVDPVAAKLAELECAARQYRADADNPTYAGYRDLFLAEAVKAEGQAEHLRNQLDTANRADTHTSQAA